MSLQTTSPASGNLQGSGKTKTSDEILGSPARGVKIITPDIWKISKPVPVLQRPPKASRTTSAVPPELKQLKSALDAIPNSGDGLGYDGWFKVICAIHYATEGSDDGLTLAIEFSARSDKHEDDDFLTSRCWPYLRSERDQLITERTLFNLAAQHGWQDPAIAADFQDERASVEAAPLRFRFLSAGEFVDRKPPGWVIRGVLPAADLVVIYGESQSGKTFFALDLVVSIALGVPWRDHKVVRGRVAYIAAEGASGAQNRLKAQAMHRGLTAASIDIHFLPDAPNFLERSQIADVIAGLKACGPVSVVVVDTLAQVMPGGNENSGEDLGKVVGHCRNIRQATGALVVLIHHSGKDASKGARGWSGLRAAADAEIEVLRADHDRVATITKLKESEDGAEFGFRLHQVPVGTDDDGEVVTSCIVDHVTAAKHVKGSRRARLGVNEETVVAALRDLLTLDGGKPTEIELVNEAASRLTQNPEKGRDTRRQRIMTAMDKLKAAGMVVILDGKAGLPTC